MKRKYSPKKLEESDMNGDEICGVWIFRGQFLQKFASYPAYVILFGLVTCLFQASHMYFVGTISTVEKRFGISSKVTGMITAGNDVSALIVSTLLTYYASKQHQPRWIGFGMYTVVLFCLLCALPHFIFGPGEVALQLTKEYNNTGTNNITANDLCDENDDRTCQTPSGNLWVSMIFFIAQFVSGIGGTLCSTIGISYLDDNAEKSKVPVILSCIFFVQMLGRMLGLYISSICQKLYIALGLSPIITNEDPRWLGAWWLGWIALALLVFVFSSMIAMFPKKLPEAIRRKRSIRRRPSSSETSASFSDLKSSLTRLFSNKTLMFNVVGVVFHFLGAAPFQLFLPKYIEVVFAQSSTSANRVLAKVGFLSGAAGIVLSGAFLSKYKPRGRTVAAWNVVVGLVVVLGVLVVSRLECSPSLMNENMKNGRSLNATCRTNCSCDYVKFSPVCSIDRTAEFISPCHAGCSMVASKSDEVYHHCKCVSDTKENMWNATLPQAVTPGFCPVNCRHAFTLFVIVLGVLKFITAAGRASTVFVTARSVDEEDKAVALALGFTLLSVFANIPAPALFGYLFDRSCVWWGKTCSGTGNCWLYDSRTLRYSLDYTSAAFIAVGVLFDIGVWNSAKDLKIFDNEVEETKNKTREESSPSDIPLLSSNEEGKTRG